jgi:hypothetical protein
VQKKNLAVAQGVVKDSPRPGDSFRVKPLHELSPTTAHVFLADNDLIDRYEIEIYFLCLRETLSQFSCYGDMSDDITTRDHL